MSPQPDKLKHCLTIIIASIFIDKQCGITNKKIDKKQFEDYVMKLLYLPAVSKQENLTQQSSWKTYEKMAQTVTDIFAKRSMHEHVLSVISNAKDIREPKIYSELFDYATKEELDIKVAIEDIIENRTQLQQLCKKRRTLTELNTNANNNSNNTNICAFTTPLLPNFLNNVIYCFFNKLYAQAKGGNKELTATEIYCMIRYSIEDECEKSFPSEVETEVVAELAKLTPSESMQVVHKRSIDSKEADPSAKR